MLRLSGFGYLIPHILLFAFFSLIGKSTAAIVIAKSKGFEVIEFNASDVRNKKVRPSIFCDVTVSTLDHSILFDLWVFTYL